MIRLPIPIKYIDFVLQQCGYRRHWKNGHGWIKKIGKGERFHAYIEDEGLEIHLDRTNAKNKHYVLRKEDAHVYTEEKRKLRLAWISVDDTVEANSKEKRQICYRVVANVGEVQKFSGKVVKRGLMGHIKMTWKSILTLLTSK